MASSIRDQIRNKCRQMEQCTGMMQQVGDGYLLCLAILEIYAKLDTLTPANTLPSQYEKASTRMREGEWDD